MASGKSSLPGSVGANGKQNWAVSPSSLVYHFATSGISVAVATSITHPLDKLNGVGGTPRTCCCTGEMLLEYCTSDVLKVRMQMQLVGERGPITGMGKLFFQIVKNEGPRSMYLGLTPALTRSVLYGGLRLGLYEPSKYVCETSFGSTNILVKIASGAFAGAIATVLTNPTEVLKVRLQMNSNVKRGAIGEMRKIVSEEGIKALWKGVGPAMTRAAALTASQLATYDEFKRVKF